MSDLLLDSLKISNFRAFQNLEIEKLGRVNLIVGENSVGKSSVLEALWLYANKGDLQAIIDILLARKELSRRIIVQPLQDKEKGEEALLAPLSYLFHGRASFKKDSTVIGVGSLHLPKNSLTVALSWFVEQIAGDGVLRLQELTPIIDNTASNPLAALSIKNGNNGEHPRIIRLDRGLSSNGFRTGLEIEQNINNFVRADGLKDEDIGKLWAKIALSDLEQDVTRALRIITPEVERVAVLGDPRFESSVIIKTNNSDKPIPLTSLGDGINRVFGIVLALVNSKNGMLLIDEIENGLHHSIQLGLWRLILSVAQRLNVQVFATTHSWDCIEAFQQATLENKQAEGLLIRLENKNDKIIPTIFDERLLEIVTREQIEVR